MNSTTIIIIVSIVLIIAALAARGGGPRVTQITRTPTHEEDEDRNA